MIENLLINCNFIINLNKKPNLGKMRFNFSNKFQLLVSKYNERKEQDVLRSEVLEEFTDEIIDLYQSLKKERKN